MITEQTNECLDYLKQDIPLEIRVVKNIIIYRKKNGLTQKQLAELCETSTSYIGLVETFKKVPRLKTIEKIAVALNLDPVFLFLEPVSKDAQTQIEGLKSRIVDNLKNDIEISLTDKVNSYIGNELEEYISKEIQRFIINPLYLSLNTEKPAIK